MLKRVWRGEGVSGRCVSRQSTPDRKGDDAEKGTGHHDIDAALGARGEVEAAQRDARRRPHRRALRARGTTRRRDVWRYSNGKDGNHYVEDGRILSRVAPQGNGFRGGAIAVYCRRQRSHHPAGPRRQRVG